MYNATGGAQVHLVPEFFHLADTSDILQIVVDMLQRLIVHNDAIPVTPSNLTRFHSRAAPAISIGDYLRRIVKYASVEKSVLLLLLIYIDRLCERHKTFTISSLTSHRFLITAVTVGSKALSDIYPTNTHFAKVGGISVVELNLLELEMCTMVQWKLAVTVETLQQYYINLVRTSATYSVMQNPPPQPISTHPTQQPQPRQLSSMQIQLQQSLAGQVQQLPSPPPQQPQSPVGQMEGEGGKHYSSHMEQGMN